MNCITWFIIVWTIPLIRPFLMALHLFTNGSKLNSLSSASLTLSLSKLSKVVPFILFLHLLLTRFIAQKAQSTKLQGIMRVISWQGELAVDKLESVTCIASYIYRKRTNFRGYNI